MHPPVPIFTSFYSFSVTMYGAQDQAIFLKVLMKVSSNISRGTNVLPEWKLNLVSI